MRYYLKSLWTIMVMTGCCYQVCGQQQAPAPLAEISTFEQNTIHQYLHYQNIMQGPRYGYFYPDVKGHQYFDKAAYELGTVTFEGIHYHDVLINYDIHNSLIMTTIVRNGLSESVILDNSRLDQFQFADGLFVNINQEDAALPVGIYQSLSEKSDAQLYLHTKKSIQSNTGRPGEPLKKFVKQDTFFLVIKGNTYTVKNKRSLLKIFEQKPEIQKYIKGSKLRFNNTDQIQTSLLKVVDQL